MNLWSMEKSFYNTEALAASNSSFVPIKLLKLLKGKVLVMSVICFNLDVIVILPPIRGVALVEPTSYSFK